MKIIQINSHRESTIKSLISLRYLILDIKFASFLTEIYNITPETDDKEKEIELYQMNADHMDKYKHLTVRELADLSLDDKITEYMLLAHEAELLGELVRGLDDTVESLLDYKQHVPIHTIFHKEGLTDSFNIMLNQLKFTVRISHTGNVKLIDSTGEVRCRCTSRGNPAYRCGSRRYIISNFVAKHFLGPKKSGYKVTHKDGNPNNFKGKNLAYIKIKPKLKVTEEDL